MLRCSWEKHQEGNHLWCVNIVKTSTSTVLTIPPFNYNIILYFRVKFSHRCNSITDLFFNFGTFPNTVKKRSYILYFHPRLSFISFILYSLLCDPSSWFFDILHGMALNPTIFLVSSLTSGLSATTVSHWRTHNLQRNLPVLSKSDKQRREKKTNNVMR